MLGHSVPTLSGGTQRRGSASLPKQGNKYIKLCISPSENQPHNLLSKGPVEPETLKSPKIYNKHLNSQSKTSTNYKITLQVSVNQKF